MFLLPYADKVYAHFEVAILTCAARVAMHPSTHPTWACPVHSRGARVRGNKGVGVTASGRHGSVREKFPRSSRCGSEFFDPAAHGTASM